MSLYAYIMSICGHKYQALTTKFQTVVGSRANYVSEGGRPEPLVRVLLGPERQRGTCSLRKHSIMSGAQKLHFVCSTMLRIVEVFKAQRRKHI